MKNKKLIIIPLLLILTIIITACSNNLINDQNLNTKTGSLEISYNLSEKVDSESKLNSLSTNDIAPKTITLKLIKGETVKTKEFEYANEKILEINNLEEGNWKVVVTVKDNDGYEIYNGEKGVKILADETTPINVRLNIEPGDLKVEVPIPDDFSASSGKVTLTDPMNGEKIEKSLTIENGTGIADFENMRASSWPIKIELSDSNGNTKNGTDKVEIIPGRQVTAIVDAINEGNLEINLIFENIPLAPKNVLASFAEIDGENAIELSWEKAENSTAVGYMVYRSMSRTGKKIPVNDELVEGTSYIDRKDIFKGNTYWYWVQAYNENGYSGEMSAPFSIIANKTVTIADRELELVIREKINKMSGSLTSEDVENIREIEAEDRNIETLKGIEYLTSLESLHLADNSISNLSPLSNLSQLRSIHVRNNEITSIKPLIDLPSLRYLYLQDNKIEDFSPIKDMDNLRSIGVSANPVSNFEATIDLLNSKDLYYISLWDMNIDNTMLNYLANNLTTAKEISLQNNYITDISSLTNMQNLIGVRLGYNHISDFSPLGEMTNLERLQIRDQYINDFSFITKLVNLERLILDESNIVDSDLEYIASLENLKHLELDETNITDLTSLSKMNNLEFLAVGGCYIDDINPLLEMDGLRRVFIPGNPLDFSEGSADMEVINQLENNGVEVIY